MDPYERADITSNTYWDEVLQHAFLAVPTQALVAQFIGTFKDFPPRQGHQASASTRSWIRCSSFKRIENGARAPAGNAPGWRGRCCPAARGVSTLYGHNHLPNLVNRSMQSRFGKQFARLADRNRGKHSRLCCLIAQSVFAPAPP
jgi:hypothetical protein